MKTLINAKGKSTKEVHEMATAHGILTQSKKDDILVGWVHKLKGIIKYFGSADCCIPRCCT